MKKYTIAVIIAFALVLLIGQYAAAEVSKEELKSISTPDKVKTSIGELKFFDGAPTEATVEKDRKSTFQPLPGTVCIQLFSMPAGAFGPK